MNIKQGDFVRIKEQYAFKVNPILHYGQCLDVGLNDDIKLNFDRRYNHDSNTWVDGYMYEQIR